MLLASLVEVASDVDSNGITYYNEEAVKRKWGRLRTTKERMAISKFKVSASEP